MTSGVGVPWRAARLRFLFDEIDHRVGSPETDLPLLSVSIHRGVIPRSDMTDREARADDFVSYKRVEPGDVVINRMRAFEGGAGVSPSRGIVSSDYAVLRTREALDPRFLHHLIRSRWFVSEMTARLRGIGNSELGNVRTPRVNVEDLGNIVISLPNIDEQRAIAGYLDIEAARLEQIADRCLRLRRLVVEREETALRAVVMSADGPDRPVSALADYVNGFPFKPTDFTATGLPVIRIAQLTDAGAEADLFDGWVPERVRLNDGDLVFSWSASLEVRVWDRGPAILNQHLFRVSPAAGVDRDWLRWALHVARSDFQEHMHGSTMTHVTRPMMREVRVPVPTSTVQREVAARANEVHAMTLSLLRTLDRQASLLVERRQALIAATVIGQFHPPGVAA